jgi:hypothetical protein
MQNSSGWRRKEILSAYSVEQIDEEAMTEFIQARTCRRKVLSQYFDRESKPTDCHRTDSVFCDWCKTTNSRGVRTKQVEQGAEQEAEQEAENAPENTPENAPENIPENTPQQAQTSVQKQNGPTTIAAKLKAVQESYEDMIKVMDQLQGQCIYCTLIHEGGQIGASILQGHRCQGQLHTYSECLDAEEDGCGFTAYQQWREGIDFGQAKHCWECGLSQSICRRLERRPEDRVPCDYPNIMLPSIFILHQQQHLAKGVETVGFQGEYDSDLYEWLNETAEGFGREWESNWMKTWRAVCEMYKRMRRMDEEDGCL